MITVDLKLLLILQQMLDKLVDQEEKHLQVNSEEFNQRHRELMELIRKAERGEDNGRKA